MGAEVELVPWDVMHMWLLFSGIWDISGTKQNIVKQNQAGNILILFMMLLLTHGVHLAIQRKISKLTNS